MNKRHLLPRAVIAGLARVLGAAGNETLRVGGSIGFRVSGKGGGTWVVNLAVPGGDWRFDDETSYSRCHTQITASPQTFELILVDSDGLDDAQRSGALRVQGDAQKWRELMTLVGAAGPLLARAPGLRELAGDEPTSPGSSSRPD